MTDMVIPPEAVAAAHKPFSDDGVLYCGWATGDRIVDGCGELYPCSTLRSHPNALAAAVGCAICNGLPGNSRCLSCQGTGRFSPPTEAADIKALVETATRLGRELGRREAAEEIAQAFEPMLYNSPDGDAFEHTHPKWEGEPDCPACWVQGIRQTLAREIATKEPK